MHRWNSHRFNLYCYGVWIVALLGSVGLATSSVDAGDDLFASHWSPVIVPTGPYRSQIKSIPIEQRPGRPFHVYGNTIRWIETARYSHQPSRPLRHIFLGAPDVFMGERLGPRPLRRIGSF